MLLVSNFSIPEIANHLIKCILSFSDKSSYVIFRAEYVRIIFCTSFQFIYNNCWKKLDEIHLIAQPLLNLRKIF